MQEEPPTMKRLILVALLALGGLSMTGCFDDPCNRFSGPGWCDE
jgi:hypothetical protein